MSTTKWTSRKQAVDFIDNWFYPAARVVAGDCYKRDQHGNYVRMYEGREWFHQQYNRHHLHPAVYDMMLHYRPDDYQQLLLEWPHKSLTDPNRLAYTRDERSAMHNGDSDIKAVITTIGKYLTRHFRHAPSDMIRDLAAKYTYGGTIVLTKDMREMVSAVMNGPRSCMSHRFNLTCTCDGRQRHPYEVYDPAIGWGMAVRSEGDTVLGRCLVYDDGEVKGFVRSYKRERDECSHSGADEAIETWLKSQGYTKWSGWDDLRVRRYALTRGGYLMPYLDGKDQYVSDDDDEHFIIASCGDYDASNTNGGINTYSHTCEDCGEGFDGDNEGAYVGVHEDCHVCDGCLGNYTYAYGRRGERYYVRDEDAVYVNDEYYDSNYLSDNNIIELANGDYEHMDNVVWIESEDAYYHADDDDICYAEDTHQYEHVNNCWRCEYSNNWYTDDEDYVEIDGNKYHPDNAPEVAEEDEGEQA